MMRAYVDAGSGSYAFSGVAVLVLLAAAAIPIAIAYVRRTTNRKAVLLVALLTSWTCVGWVIAVVLAAIGKPETSVEHQPTGPGSLPLDSQPS